MEMLKVGEVVRIDAMGRMTPKDLWAALRLGQPVMLVLLGSLVFRLGLSALMPLGIDEAYAVVVSRSHSLSYYDHPALSFALARLMADVTGSEAGFVVRLPFVVMGSLSGLVLYDITRRLAGPKAGAKAGLWAVGFYTGAPFFLISAGMMVVPDGPLELFLLLSFRCVQPLLERDQSIIYFGRDLRAWGLAGLSLGLALLSKYHAILFGVGAVIALLARPEWRHWFRSPALWAGMVMAALGAVPTLWWNADHGWISFVFQSERAHDKTSITKHISEFLKVILGQLIYLMPWTWVWSLRQVGRTVSGREACPVAAALGWIVAVPVVVFAGAALFGHGNLPHWAMSGFLLALPVCGMRAAEMGGRGAMSLKRGVIGVGGVVAVLTFCLSLQARTAVMMRGWTSEAPAFDLDWQVQDWDVAHQIDQMPHDYLVTGTWVEAARLGLEVRPQPLYMLSDPHHFRYMFAKVAPLQRGLYVVPLRLDHAEADQTRALDALKGRYQPLAQPVRLTSRRMGYKSFYLMLVPVGSLRPSS